ncbi:F-box only protein 39-like [Nematolebias whitei]|uniref:F-box only protein 39-like n=1 Tax=Nematolebias whitei TaxID=451745 RepID=UPI00189754C1|nr:F-box only protein 39-like [Nematolebias whitei]
METPGLHFWMEGSDVTDEDCEEETSRDLERFSGWNILPDVALLHIFGCLPDAARGRAARVCHRWYQIMRSPCLWRCRHFCFNGHLSKYKPPEYQTAMGYIRSLGVFLETLNVTVCPPRSQMQARRLHKAICTMMKELIRVRATLKSLSLTSLELDTYSWSQEHRSSLADILIQFFIKGASKLNFLCLYGMRNDVSQGVNVLWAMLKYQQDLSPHGSLSSLDLKDFFSTHLPVRFNCMPYVLRQLQGLTYLGLSYSCLSDELIMELCQSHRGAGYTSGRSGSNLQTLECTLSELPKLVCSRSWATLASSCPDLEVHLSVEKVITTDSLAQILLPEIPLRNFQMTAFYYPNENFSIRPLLCHMLPLYGHCLQYLALDVCNRFELVDEELLRLVSMCKRLVDLKVRAFMDVFTVGRLLGMRLKQRSLLNKIKVKIYSQRINITEQEDDLKKVLSFYKQQFPPELQVLADVIPVL